jgi:hypothetical protein
MPGIPGDETTTRDEEEGGDTTPCVYAVDKIRIAVDKHTQAARCCWLTCKHRIMRSTVHKLHALR